MKITIAIPAFNEEQIIAKNSIRLESFLKKALPEFDWQVIIADNASTDNTRRESEEAARASERIKYFFTPKKGKGEAVLSAWTANPADIYAFTDADLAADISALPELIRLIALGQADFAIGSRYLPGSEVRRSFFRKFFSHGYRMVLGIAAGLRASDAPCGLKAISAKAAEAILPLIEDREWFFDTELLLRAEKAGLIIAEVPVKWTEPRKRKSKVSTVKLSCDYLKKIWKIKKST